MGLHLTRLKWNEQYYSVCCVQLMNSCPMGGFRRDEGGRGKRDGRRGQPGGNLFIDPTNNWKAQRTSYTVDTTKLKAATQKVTLTLSLSWRLQPILYWRARFEVCRRRNPLSLNTEGTAATVIFA